jgi:hypothetical protein
MAGAACESADGDAAMRSWDVARGDVKKRRKQRMLMLNVNALHGQLLGLEREARAIQSELDRARHRDRFELHTCWAAEASDLLDALRRYKPTIVHFSGHTIHPMAGAPPDGVVRRDIESLVRGNLPEGLCFQRSDGGIEVVSPCALKDAIRAVGPSVRLIVLNACHTEPHARALRSEIDCVIGTHGAIRDDAAIHFATGLYGGIFGGFSNALAFDQGRAEIQIRRLTDRFRLLARPGVDPSAIVLANPRPRTERPRRRPPRPLK